MQVARNIFLYHEKNITRKIEEVIIALLIENCFNVSKERVLEIYLNIIEFGPGVYGIVEASSFYFGRKVQDLGLLEWLVIVYIIPRPIHFYDALEAKSKILRSNLIKHIKNSTKKMLKRQIITTCEIENIPDEIKFSAKFGTISLGL